MLPLLLILSAGLLAYANGANDNFKPVATLYGSGTLGYDAARRLALVAQLAGSLASVLLAGALLRAFSGKGLVPAFVVADPRFLVAVGVGAAATVLIATRAGLPVSTTHALIGGLVGAGAALAPGGVAWSALGSRYFAPLLLSPLMAVAAAALLYRAARWARLQLGWSAATVLRFEDRVEAVTVDADGALVLQRTGARLTAEDLERCDRRYRGSLGGLPAQRLVDIAHTASAFALGFARGLNDTPKVLALLVAAQVLAVDPRVSLLAVATLMAVGGHLHARRLAETLGHRITTLNHGQGLTANVVSSGLVIGASLLGSPVSTTHVSTGALFGIGLTGGKTNTRVVGGILMAWVATLPLAAACAAATVALLAALA